MTLIGDVDVVRLFQGDKIAVRLLSKYTADSQILKLDLISGSDVKTLHTTFETLKSKIQRS